MAFWFPASAGRTAVINGRVNLRNRYSSCPRIEPANWWQQSVMPAKAGIQTGIAICNHTKKEYWLMLGNGFLVSRFRGKDGSHLRAGKLAQEVVCYVSGNRLPDRSAWGGDLD
jgi:hypothetical protein